MGRAEQERLNLLFEMETIKCPLMNYIAPGVSLKVVTDLGNKDQNGNKKRFYEETMYPTKKYGNVDKLVSANFRINTYLLLEYPNPRYVEGSMEMKNHAVFIRAYAMDDVINKMREFNDGFIKAYTVKKGELCMLSDKVKEVTVYPSSNTSLTFKNSIFENVSQGIKEMGVQIIVNEEFSFTISAENTWPEMVYKISRCDLMMLGMQMIQSYMSLLPGMAVTEIGKGQYTSTSRYVPYWGEDPDDIVNQPDSVGVNRSKPVTEEEKKKSFFSDL